MAEFQDKSQQSAQEKPTSLEEKPQLEEKVSSPSERAGLEVEKKIEAEPAKEGLKEKEELKEEVRQPASPPSSAQAQKQIKKLKDLDQQNQVKELCDLAFQKGLDFAIEVAKGLDNAYVLDKLHDTLVDELYKKLVEQGKLKRI